MARSRRRRSTSCCGRSSALTIRLGLLDPPEMVPYSKIKDSPEPWNTEKDKAVSEKMALESVVLLKNANSLSAAEEGFDQVDCRHRAAGRLGALGLVRRHASLCDYAACRESRTKLGRTSR